MAVKKQTTTEAVKEEKTPLAVAPAPEMHQLTLSFTDSAWGSENIDAEDVIVPKLMLMQGLSKKVTEGEAVPGQVRDSLANTLLGGKVTKDQTKPIEVVPFSSFKTWVVFKKVQGKDEYQETFPVTPENITLPINDVINGEEIRRDKCINFYVLIPGEIATGEEFPYVISLRRYGMNAAKKMSTIGAKQKMYNKPLASKVITLAVKTVKNEKGEFFVFDMEGSRDATEKELASAYKWATNLKTAKVKVDDADVREEGSLSRENVPEMHQY